MILTKQIKGINLVALMEADGTKLKRQGNKYIGLCPFHDDHNPSMSVFADNHYKCYACGEYGDPLDYVCKRHGLSVKEGLKYLGISIGPMTAEMRQRIAESERKRKEKQAYEQRKRDLLYTLSTEIRRSRKVIANIRTVEDMDATAALFHRLPYLEHCWDILFEGNPQGVKAVMDALKGLKLINKKPLFEPDFDYRQWLRDFTNGRTDSTD